MNPKSQQVIDLKNDGWSLRNIANEVGISVFTVRSILSSQVQPIPNPVDKAIDAYPNDNVPKAEVKNLLSGLLAEHSNTLLRSAKKKLVDQFNRLVDDWLDNADDCTWDEDDLNMYNDSMTRLKKDLFDLCEGLEISPESLAIFHNATQIKRVFKGALKRETEINFEFDDSIYEIIEGLKVEDFDDPHTGVDLLELIDVEED